MGDTTHFQTGDIIIRQGNPATCAYLMLKGRAEVYLEKDQRVVTLAELEIGSIFGESALFEEESSYGAHVKALEDTEIVAITPEDFKEKIESCDPMIQSIVRTLIERQRHTNEVLLNRETQGFMDIDLIDASA